MRYPFLYKVMGNLDVNEDGLHARVFNFIRQNFPEFKIFGPYDFLDGSEEFKKLSLQSHQLHRLVLNKKNDLNIAWSYNGKSSVQSFLKGDFILLNDQVDFDIKQPLQVTCVFLLDPDIASYLPEIGS